MKYENKKMPQLRRIALVAHDHEKSNLLDWVNIHRDILKKHQLFATGTTGRLIMESLDMNITCLKSGPLGGDQQLGALISEEKIDVLIFFWDPLEPQPHDPDVKALLRLAAVWNIACASNRASADFLINSPFFEGEYTRRVPDYSTYTKRTFTSEK